MLLNIAPTTSSNLVTLGVYQLSMNVCSAATTQLDETIPPFHFIFFKSRVDLEIYLIFDVNEFPVYSSFGHFRYAFTCVCPTTQYIFTYYSTDLSPPLIWISVAV